MLCLLDSKVFLQEHFLLKSFFKGTTLWVLLPKIGESVGGVCLNLCFMILDDVEKKRGQKKVILLRSIFACCRHELWTCGNEPHPVFLLRTSPSMAYLSPCHR